MARTTHKELLEAGVHFGHMRRKRNPNMDPYIFMERNGIHIIDLNKSLVKLEAAAEAAGTQSSVASEPLFDMVHGVPGAGKSKLIGWIRRLFKEELHWLLIQCNASTDATHTMSSTSLVFVNNPCFTQAVGTMHVCSNGTGHTT